MIYLLLAALGLSAGFAGLAYGAWLDRKERILRYECEYLLIGPNVEIGSYGILSGTCEGPRRFRVVGYVGPMTAVQFLDTDGR